MFRNFLNGRYGFDNLSLVMIILGFLFLRMNFLWVVGLAFIGYSIFRISSKDIYKRKEELAKFNGLVYKLRNNFGPLGNKINNLIQSVVNKAKTYKGRFQQRKYYVFHRCPQCKNMLRLPKNKGKLKVTCPKCKFEYIKRT